MNPATLNATPRPLSRRRQRLTRLIVIYLFILPALVPMAVLVGIPLVQTVFFSFTNLKEKNFDVWTLGLEPDESATGDAAPKDAALAKVDANGPAARAGVPVPRAFITEVNGEKVRNLAALRRLLGKAQREFTNKRATGVKLTVATESANPSGTNTYDVSYKHLPLDWRIDPERSDSTWGMVGLKNYKEILIPAKLRGITGADTSASDSAYQFYRTLGVTAAWTALCVALHYIIGLALALLLNRPVRGTKFYRVLLMVPWAVPVYVSAFAWRWLFNGQYGLFNNLLAKLGHSPIPWLSDTGWTFLAATITNVWLGIPFMMIVLLAGLQAVPGELYEAAEIDGCNRWQSIRNVTLPMLRPVSMTVILLGTIWTFNMFNVVWLLQNGGRAVEILATRSFRLFYEGRDFAMSAAYGVVILAILLAFSAIYWRIVRKGAEDVY